MSGYGFSEPAGNSNQISISIEESIGFFYKIRFINIHSGIFCFNQSYKTVIVTRVQNTTRNTLSPEFQNIPILVQHRIFIRDI